LAPASARRAAITYPDEVRKWIAFENMRILNTLGMYRWVENHRRGEW
jgi:hypothetical protein